MGHKCYVFTIGVVAFGAGILDIVFFDAGVVHLRDAQFSDLLNKSLGLSLSRLVGRRCHDSAIGSNVAVLASSLGVILNAGVHRRDVLFSIVFNESCDRLLGHGCRDFIIGSVDSDCHVFSSAHDGDVGTQALFLSGKSDLLNGHGRDLNGASARSQIVSSGSIVDSRLIFNRGCLFSRDFFFSLLERPVFNEGILSQRDF